MDGLQVSYDESIDVKFSDTVEGDYFYYRGYLAQRELNVTEEGVSTNTKLFVAENGVARLFLEETEDVSLLKNCIVVPGPIILNDPPPPPNSLQDGNTVVLETDVQEIVSLTALSSSG